MATTQHFAAAILPDRQCSDPPSNPLRDALARAARESENPRFRRWCELLLAGESASCNTSDADQTAPPTQDHNGI
jgi:hypothetical protein